MAIYNDKHYARLAKLRDTKREQSAATAERDGVRYCASRTHYKPLAEVTRRRHGKTGPWICDECYNERAKYLQNRI